MENKIEIEEELWVSHSGDLGDIIYAGPALKALAAKNNKPVTVYLFNIPNKTREPMTQRRCDAIKPLLLRQPYIKDVVFKAAGQQDHAINGFRDHLRHHKTLASAHCAAVGVDPLVVNQQWLKVDPVACDYSVIFARSPRYHNRMYEWKIPYAKYKDQVGFIGLEEEHRNFEKFVGKIPHIKTNDLLEVAQLIAGAKLFVGNQSCPLAIAHGLHAPVLQEVAPWPSDNCRFPRDNAIFATNNSYVLPEIA